MILWLNIFAWIGVVAVFATGTSRLLAGKGRDHDAIKFAFTLVALIILAFNFRWVIAPESEFALELLRVGSIVVAGFLIAIVRFYQRA